MILFNEETVDIIQGRGRQKIQTIRTISPEDLAYIAGFVDGEGTISILRYYKSNYKEKRRMDWRAFVGINNTNKEVLEWIMLTVGAGNLSKSNRREGYKTCWKYSLSGSNSIIFSQALLPYLKVKRTNALILIELGKTLANSYMPRKTPEYIKEKREELTNQIQSINRRGLIN